jgi:hypothetical protein
MQSVTRKAIHDFLKNFTKKSLKTFDVDLLKRAYPFHRLFFDDLGLVAFKQERSMVTRMGQSLYPQLARMIAAEKYAEVALEKTIEGELNVAMLGKIDQIVRELRSRQRTPNHVQEMNEIYSAASGTKSRKVRVIADVFIGDFFKGPFFIELKTPQPNLDICAESKSKILTFKALWQHHNPQACLAFYYNPFVTRADYAHSPTKQIMDMQAEVLMGEEFWDEIGGSGTFAELLEIIEDVGNEIRREIK